MILSLSVPDEHRIDPAQAKRWWVSGHGRFTIVVATSAEEAAMLGLIWFAHSRGDRTVDLGGPKPRVREATIDDVDRWLELRALERKLSEGVKS